MKKLSYLLLAAALVLALAGCGKKPLDEEELQEAAENYGDYARIGAETRTFEVVKRQTDEDAKTDLAWITIRGETDNYAVSRSFEIRSAFYNDGWQVEEISPWYNAEAPDGMKPRTTPTEEQVQEYVEGLDLSAYSSFEYVECDGISDERTPAVGEVTELAHPQEAVITNDEAYDTWYVTVTYHYQILDETVEIPIHYTFDFYGGEWVASMEEDEENMERSAMLNQEFLGTWEFGDWTATVPGGVLSAEEVVKRERLEVLSIDEDGKGCDVTWELWYYERMPQSYNHWDDPPEFTAQQRTDGGHLTLRCVDGDAPEFFWDDGGDHYDLMDYLNDAGSSNLPSMTYDMSTAVVNIYEANGAARVHCAYYQDSDDYKTALIKVR